MKRKHRLVKRSPTDKAIIPCRCCSASHIRGCMLKGTFICDTCATTRRYPMLDKGLRSRRRMRQTADGLARAESGDAGQPSCPICRQRMRLFPAGVKLKPYMKQLKRRGSR